MVSEFCSDLSSTKLQFALKVAMSGPNNYKLRGFEYRPQHTNYAQGAATESSVVQTNRTQYIYKHVTSSFAQYFSSLDKLHEPRRGETSGIEDLPSQQLSRSDQVQLVCPQTLLNFLNVWVGRIFCDSLTRNVRNRNTCLQRVQDNSTGQSSNRAVASCRRKKRHANHRKWEGTNKIHIDKDGLWLGDGTENISPIKTEINPNYIQISSSYNTQRTRSPVSKQVANDVYGNNPCFLSDSTETHKNTV